MFLRGRTLAVVIFLPAMVGGCGSKSNVPDLASVSGTVTYRGHPVENALVVFMPETPGERSANGTTDSKGRYRLTTDGFGKGAVLGEHRVTITARGPDKEVPGEVGPVGLPETTPGDPLIPAKYFKPETSGYVVEVTAKGITADFELQD